MLDLQPEDHKVKPHKLDKIFIKLFYKKFYKKYHYQRKT